MKVRVSISFNEGRKKIAYVRSLLAAINCEDGLAGEDSFLCGLYGHMFDADDPRLKSLRDTLRSEGFRWTENIVHEYTDTELRQFPLLWVSLDLDPVGLERSTGFETQYDLSMACPRCGTGARQTSPLMLPLNQLPKKGDLILGPRFKFLAGPRLRQALIDADVTGLELRQALSHRNQEPLPWWQMYSEYEMPKMSKKIKNLGRETKPGWGCPVCERDMHVRTNREPLEFLYDRNSVDPQALPDIVHTWECWGRSILNDDPMRDLVRGFATPFTLVKPKVFEIFKNFKIKDMDFVPVRIE
jgi:hypothetical protein